MGIMRLRWPIALAVTAGVIAWSAVTHPWGWLYGFGVHPYPRSSSTPWTYQLLSGLVPALTVLSLATLLAGAWHHVNCHKPRCWRIGKHKVSGTPWCNRHHEDARPERSTDDILRDISEHLGQLAAAIRQDREARTAPGPRAGSRSKSAPAP